MFVSRHAVYMHTALRLSVTFDRPISVSDFRDLAGTVSDLGFCEMVADRAVWADDARARSAEV